MEEVKLGLLSEPVDSMEKLNMANPCLVRRHGLWEQHGNAKAPSVRVWDDFLEGGQNGTVGYQFTHRPATLDNVAASMRAMSERYREPMEFFHIGFCEGFQAGPWCDRVTPSLRGCPMGPYPRQTCIHDPLYPSVWGSIHTVKFCQISSVVLLCHCGTCSTAI